MYLDKHVIHKCQSDRLHGWLSNPHLRDQTNDRLSNHIHGNVHTFAKLLSQGMLLCRSDSSPCRPECSHRQRHVSPHLGNLPTAISSPSLLLTFRQDNPTPEQEHQRCM